MRYKTEIPGFDVLKFMMSFGIVAIHCHLAEEAGTINIIMGGVIEHYNSLCVPGFFTISSFLFFRKCWAQGFHNSMGAYLRFVKRLAMVYSFYFLLLLPVVVVNRGYFSMGTLDGVLMLLIDLSLRYTYPGSWFLSALVVSTTIIYFCGRYVKTYWLLLPMLVLHLYVYNTDMFPKNLQVYYDLYECHIRTMRLSFTAAMFPVCLGSILSHPCLLALYDKIKSYNKYVWFVLFALFVLNCLIDDVWLPYLLLVLMFISFYNTDLQHSVVYYKLREYSILFFFWHFIVLQVFKIVWHDEVFHLFGISLFFIVLVSIFIISTVILRLENEIHFGWLKYSH